jgi:type III pantothenate kinase
VVVDFGTSTNFDVVSAKGEFLGGRLAPGIEISVDALASAPRGCSRSSSVEPRSVIGKTTSEALQSGLLYGFAGQVDGMVARIADELDEPPVVLATGGLSHLMFGVCETLDHHEPDLTLHGLRLVFEKNT